MQRKDLPSTQPNEINRLKECTNKLYNTAARQTKEALEGDRHSNDVKSDQPVYAGCMGDQQHDDCIAKSIYDKFVEQMTKLEDTFEDEKEELELKIKQLSDIKEKLENRVKELEKISNTTQAREKLDIIGFERLDTGKSNEQHDNCIAIHDNFVKRMTKLEDEFEEERKEYKLRIKQLSDINNKLENHFKELENISNTALAREKQDITGFERLDTGKQLLTSDMSTQTENCQKCVELDDERSRLVEKIEKLQLDRDGIENHARQLKADNDDLLVRLSKLAGDKLTDNNPAITDLSDSNRPVKLGEFYSELYDNEWTDAYDALLKAGYTDDETIPILNRTLKHVMTYCEAYADKLVIGLPDTIYNLFEENESSFLKINSYGPCQPYNVCDIWSPKVSDEKRSEIKIPKQVTIEENAAVDIRDTVRRFTKEISVEIVPLVKMGYLKAANWNDNCIEDLKPFILKCVYLCWMMTVQSPRMVLHEITSNAPFDKGLYKEYITSGPVVRYVVWPALLLQEGGPLVCKGVAEGMQPQSGEVYV